MEPQARNLIAKVWVVSLNLKSLEPDPDIAAPTFRPPSLAVLSVYSCLVSLWVGARFFSRSGCVPPETLNPKRYTLKLDLGFRDLYFEFLKHPPVLREAPSSTVP